MEENEKKELINKITVEETNKLRIADMLKETTKLAGDIRLSAIILKESDDKLAQIFEKYAPHFDDFNKELAQYRANC